MGKVVIYKNMAEFISDFKPNMVRLVDRGCEGVTYTDEKYAYKMYIYDYPKNEYYRKDYNQIVTTDDFDLESFAFPIDLYVVDKLLMGVKSRYVPNDMMVNWKKRASIEALRKIDFDNLIIAYLRMLEDVDILSDNKVEINDLIGNLVFDGKTLTGVDTCFYEKKSALLNRRLYNYNLYSLKYAISYYFRFLIGQYPELDRYFGSGLTHKTDVIEGIDKVRKIIRQV